MQIWLNLNWYSLLYIQMVISFNSIKSHILHYIYSTTSIYMKFISIFSILYILLNRLTSTKNNKCKFILTQWKKGSYKKPEKFIKIAKM